MKASFIAQCLLVVAGLVLAQAPVMAAVRIKDLCRVDGIREDVVLGYGLVIGLAGTGDSRRSLTTTQSVSNVLAEFGLQIPPGAINSRNVAAVLVTAKLPGFLSVGDRLDVNVASIGDASSLAGGTLLLTPLRGTDRELYAVAQGALSIGGFRFEQSGTVRQKNHPTSGIIPEGAIAERQIEPRLLGQNGSLDLILNDPDFTTASRIVSVINQQVHSVSASAVAAGRIRLALSSSNAAGLVGVIAAVENLDVEPDRKARVVVNERTGTIVSGGNVWLSAVTVTQGDIRVSIDQRLLVSQPEGIFDRPSSAIQSVVVPEATIDAQEEPVQAVNLPQGATIADLVAALRNIKASSRDVIAVLQGIKRAGALHAELIIQ